MTLARSDCFRWEFDRKRQIKKETIANMAEDEALNEHRYLSLYFCHNCCQIYIRLYDIYNMTYIISFLYNRETTLR